MNTLGIGRTYVHSPPVGYIFCNVPPKLRQKIVKVGKPN